MVCLFGLGVDGVPATWDSDLRAQLGMSTGWNPTNSNPQVDRLPLEATVGWDATLNGNLAEQLQEPTLMGAYEGAGITVLVEGCACSRTEQIRGVMALRRTRYPDWHHASDGSNANNDQLQCFPQQLLTATRRALTDCR